MRIFDRGRCTVPTATAPTKGSTNLIKLTATDIDTIEIVTDSKRGESEETDRSCSNHT